MYNKILFLSLITILLFSNILFAQTTNDITLKPGFNFISFTNLIALNPTELKALNSSIEDIFLFSSSAGSFLSASEGTLSTLSIGKGYIIKNNASSDIKISITGNAITLINPINLKTGFNLVGFSQASSTNTFEKLMTDNTIIKGCYKWSPTAGSFIQVIRNELGVINKIDGVDPTIKTGESYFFNMYGDSALTYDTTTISLSPASYDIPTPKVANPVITPNGGTVLSSQKIAITCTTEGAEINYIIDDGSSNKYTVPLTITKNCTLKVTSSKLGWNNSDLVTATFVLTLNPELEVTGSLPSTALSSPPNNTNYAATLGTKGNTISVVRADSENTEIGTVVVNATNYIANIPIGDTNYTAILVIKDNMGRILFRNILGKTLTKAEIPASTSKIKISGVNIDSTSTAMALLVKEKNIEVGKITSVTSADLQNGIATKISNISNEITQNFSSNPTIINEVAKAVNTVTTAVLSTSVNTTIVPTNISTATELLSSFVKVIKEPTLQPIITQNQLYTSVTITAEQKIDSSTTIIDPILKVKNPIFSINSGTYNSTQQLSISSPTGATIKYTLDGTTPSSTNGLTYTSPIIISQSKTIKAIAVKSGMNDSDLITATYTIILLQAVAMPSFIPTTNSTFLLNQQVSISCTTSGATIYYTTDGTTPTTSNTLYTAPFAISATTVIKAIAVKSGMANSDIANTTYTKLGKVATPSFTPTTNSTFSSNQQVSITCTTSGATIYYTTDGTAPATLSTLYTAPFTITATKVIKAIAIKSGMADSDIASTTYTKLEKVATPSFTPTTNSTFSLNQQVSINCATAGATIYYTTDGTTPATSSILYTGPFAISATTLIKVIAVKNGMANSDIANATYTKLEKVATPSFTPTSGTIISASQQVSISCTTEGATIHYTLNGTTPTTSSTLYTSPFTITSTTSINAIAVKNGCTNSDIASAYLRHVIDYFDFIDNGSNITITKFKEIGNEPIIPASINNKPVTSIGYQAFLNCRNITNVTLPNSIVNISNCAFQGCNNLKSINIPDGVKSFGDSAFAGCSRLTSINIPDGMTSIGNTALAGCSSLTSINIPNSVTSIGNAFTGCSGLTNINIPNGLSSIGNGMFSRCTNLNNFTIPNSVTSIGESAFEGCTSLANVTIPSSVTNIGAYAFRSCPRLVSITIPNSVTNIGNCAFEGDTGLTSAIVPNSISSIGDYVFEGCTSLTSITLPNSITSIGGSAFEGCTSLTNLTIPNSVTRILGSTFKGCTSLSSIIIPNSITNIGGSAFYGCTSLTSVIISNDSIGDQMFKGCTRLSSIIIPNNVTNIGFSAFEGCSGLTNVEISNTSIGDQMFKGCTGLTNLTIPNSVVRIGISAFEGCTGLTSATIPNSVGFVGSTMFANCTNLTNVTVSNNSIANYMFMGCTSLSSIILSNTVTYIGSYAFEGCINLKNITIPNAVTNIGTSLFSGCTGLTSIIIPDSITSIDNNAFYGCTGLTSIIIPKNVTNLGTNSFYGCTSLVSIYFYGNAPATLGQVFYNCATNFKIYYIDGKTGWTNPWNGFLAETFVP